MKKYKKKIIISSVILLLAVAVLIVVFYVPNNKYKSDSDYSFYQSDYMVYSDGKLTVKNPNYSDFDIYESEDKKISYSCEMLSDISKYSAKAQGTYVIYSDDGLKIYNNESKAENLIVKNYDYMTLGNNKVFYTYNNIIFCYDIVNENTFAINDTTYESVNSLDFSGDYLCVFYNDNNFRKINIYENYELKADFKLNSEISDFHNFDDAYIEINKEQIIVYQGWGEESVVSFYDFDGKKSQNENFDEYYKSTINNREHSILHGNYVIYTLRNRTDSVAYDRTIQDEDNGLYIEDLKSGEVKKLSDKCEFDDILVTDNFIYCFKINYAIPKSIINAKDFTLGYELVQIPIK